MTVDMQNLFNHCILFISHFHPLLYHCVYPWNIPWHLHYLLRNNRFKVVQGYFASSYPHSFRKSQNSNISPSPTKPNPTPLMEIAENFRAVLEAIEREMIMPHPIPRFYFSLFKRKRSKIDFHFLTYEIFTYDQLSFFLFAAWNPGVHGHGHGRGW